MPTSTPRKPTDRKPKAQKKGVTSIADWKSKSAGTKSFDVELPSGNVAKVKNIQITKLVEMDIFPDSLEAMIASKTQVAGKDNVEIKEPDEAEVKKAMSNPKDLAKLMTSVERIVALAVVEPPVLLSVERFEAEDGTVTWEEIPEDERDEDALYTDEIDLEDRMFIFQLTVGGTSDLDAFRGKFGTALGAMGDGESLPL